MTAHDAVAITGVLLALIAVLRFAFTDLGRDK